MRAGGAAVYSYTSQYTHYVGYTRARATTQHVARSRAHELRITIYVAVRTRRYNTPDARIPQNICVRIRVIHDSQKDRASCNCTKEGEEHEFEGMDTEGLEK